jgi:hypothetical protein
MTMPPITNQVLARAAAFGRRVGVAVLRQLVHHPHTFDRLDASPATLWPSNPEEADPPRWRLDAVRAPAPAPMPERDTPCLCPGQPPRRLVSQGS